MDRPGLAEFLRRRREAVQPADVGLPPGSRRRTEGLRREEVAQLAGMSTDYLSRLEQQRGPQPSMQMVTAIARALRLSSDETDHLFRLCGHGAPTRVQRSEHVSPALLRILDRLHDTPAMVVTDLGQTLVQNRLALALLGDQTSQTGMNRFGIWRWFTDPSSRAIYPESYWETWERAQVANLRAALSRGGDDARITELITRLRQQSPDFAGLWDQHEVAVKGTTRKVVVHPELGPIDLDCQPLNTDDLSQSLLVFTATPGTEGHEKLALLGVIGTQDLVPAT
jgi:transcriptional regulator with XRE-family HTH domain